ncbi:phosphatidate cytidylyltransferase [SAR92 clade bacterium H455]|uniref:Phosphatidate cytidylyltransferase n=1 Tax=SAR92 clade bacterium H455 TaxID=2974818 RepID=A0ABY5TP29_9GAMM|nr:phosphatidate cytidylyltransferase [SAR92 clade bacterium H455]
MFKQRVITAIALVLGLVALLFNLNPLNFSLIVAPVVLLAGWEWGNLMGLESKRHKFSYIALLALTIATAALSLDLFGTLNISLGQTLCLIASILWAVVFLWIQGYPSSAILWSPRPILGLLGIALLTITWVAIALIIHQPHGPWLLLFAFAVVALADVGGYVAGNLFGKHKLAPLVSPGKTWEGFFGGILLQCILIASMASFMPEKITTVMLVALVIPVSLYSVLGDLFESMIKRHSGVKDSGNILPGHGGVLDRIDGLIAALPLFALLFLLLSPF